MYTKKMYTYTWARDVPVSGEGGKGKGKL